MALSQVSTCSSKPKYNVRFLALVLCICIASYQLLGCIKKIIHPPTTTHNSFHLNKTLKYPSVTICRNPGYKIHLFSKYGVFEQLDPAYTSFWKEFNFENYTLDEFFEETTFSQEEVVPLHGFDGKPDALEIQQITKLTYGKCFKFIPRIVSTRWTKSGGYSLYMTTPSRRENLKNHDSGKKQTEILPEKDLKLRFGLRESAKFGFHVFIHEPNEQVSDDGDQSESYIEYVYIEGAKEFEYILSVSEFRNLPSSDNNCRNDFNYSRSQCKERCLAEEITKLAGCSTPWLKNLNLPRCSSFEETKNLIKAYNEYIRKDNTQCNCPRSCNITIYQPYVAHQNRLDYGDQCAVSLYYMSNLVIVTEEIAIYDWSLFLADLGGSLGFLLGLSVLGIINMIEQIGKMCFSYKTAKKDLGNEVNKQESTKEGVGESGCEKENCKNTLVLQT